MKLDIKKIDEYILETVSGLTEFVFALLSLLSFIILPIVSAVFIGFIFSQRWSDAFKLAGITIIIFYLVRSYLAHIKRIGRAKKILGDDF